MSKLNIKIIPNGNLPYESTELCKQMMRKLYGDIPYLVELPKINKTDTTLNRTISGFGGLKMEKNNLVLNENSELFKRDLNLLGDIYNEPTKDKLEKFGITAPYLETFKNMLKEYPSKYAVLKLFGIFSLTRNISNIDTRDMLLGKIYRKFCIQAITAKALWFIETVREISPETKPVIVFDEPLLNTFSNIKRINEVISDETLTSLFAKVFQKVQSHGGLVCVQSFSKCNWLTVLNAKPDVISFAAYTNPNNLNIIPDEINQFMSQGGVINWGIIPVDNEKIIKNTTLDYISNRLSKTMEELATNGGVRDLIYSHSSVSVQGDVANIPLFFAERAHMMAKQLSAKMPTKPTLPPPED